MGLVRGLGASVKPRLSGPERCCVVAEIEANVLDQGGQGRPFPCGRCYFELAVTGSAEESAVVAAGRCGWWRSWSSKHGFPDS